MSQNEPVKYAWIDEKQKIVSFEVLAQFFQDKVLRRFNDIICGGSNGLIFRFVGNNGVLFEILIEGRHVFVRIVLDRE